MKLKREKGKRKPETGNREVTGLIGLPGESAEGALWKLGLAGPLDFYIFLLIYVCFVVVFPAVGLALCQAGSVFVRRC